MRNKALYITAIVLIIALLTSSLGMAASNKISVNLNGKPLALQAADNPSRDPQSGLIYATPALIKALGANTAARTVKVTDKQGKKVTKYQLVITKGQTTWTFTVGLDTCIKVTGKGKPVLLSTGSKARIVGDKVHTPLVFVAGQLGYTAVYDVKSNVVNIAVKKVAKPPVKPQPKQSYINPDGTYNIPWEIVEAKNLNPCLEFSVPSRLGSSAQDSCGYYEIRYYAPSNDFQVEIMTMRTPEAKAEILNVMKAFFPKDHAKAYAKVTTNWDKHCKSDTGIQDSGTFDHRSFRCWSQDANLIVQIER